MARTCWCAAEFPVSSLDRTRAKRCYRLEALGEQALQESAATALRISEAITSVLGRDWARKWKKEWKKQAG